MPAAPLTVGPGLDSRLMAGLVYQVGISARSPSTTRPRSSQRPVHRDYCDPMRPSIPGFRGHRCSPSLGSPSPTGQDTLVTYVPGMAHRPHPVPGGERDRRAPLLRPDSWSALHFGWEAPGAPGRQVSSLHPKRSGRP